MAAPTRARRLWLLAAAAAGLFFAVLVGRFWHPVYGFTAFFQLDATNDDLKLQAFRDHPVFVYRDTGGYDGLYYAQLALDPTLHDPQLPRAMDSFSYRARRILPAATAWVLGAGHPTRVIAVYSVLNVLCWVVLAVLLWRVLAVEDVRGWLAWTGVLFSAGALCSVRLALTDLPAATLLTAALAAAESERKRTALATLAAAGLARETTLLGIAGLVKPPWISLKNIVRVVLAALPLALWLWYVRRVAGAAEAGWGNFTWPGAGWWEKCVATVNALRSMDDHWLAWTTAAALLGLTVQALYLLLTPRLQDRWWRVGIAYVVLLAMLGTAVWEGFPGAATRVLLPLTLAFNVAACRSRARLAWLLIGNIGIGAGLLAMRDVPRDPRELAAAGRGGTACIAELGTGWYGRERSGRHTWTWTRQAGTITLRTWPPTEAQLQLTFRLRSLTPRTVVLRQNGREVWRAEAGPVHTAHAATISVTGGAATLEFATDTPPVPENAVAGGRELAFALYDLRVAVPNR